MTEIIPSNNPGQRKGFSRSKKLSVRIDMTPMVDLGFLLITFFIFTSTMNDPASMKLVMPKDGENTPIKETGALTILANDNTKIYYYEGTYNTENIRVCSLLELREIVVAKKRSTPEKDFFIVIKPSANANYGHVVDVLDEMTICEVKRYALTALSAEETLFLQEWTR